MTAQQGADSPHCIKWATMSEEQLTRTLSAMAILGGGFVKAMAIAMYRADSESLQRLQDAFPELAWRYGPGSGPYQSREGEGE